ncbi:hypothetical protein NB706_003610 [Xanthomonas sacchari]|nr:hypothetical protein [Xanthomonas sacchari]
MDTDTPKITTMPMVARLADPGPPATTNGIAPTTVASEVIRIGRRRTAEASTIASRTLRPASRNWLANSTIRMPFLAASPTSITMPIWLNRLSVPPLIARPISAPSTPSGTVSMITSGWMKLSNCAASTRYTISSARAKVSSTAPPAFWYSRDSPFQSSCA